MTRWTKCEFANTCDYPESECPHKRKHTATDGCGKQTAVCSYRQSQGLPTKVKCVPAPVNKK
jgi:hypothetical protein